MKTAIKTAVAELLPVLLIRPLESDFTPGERTVDADGEKFITLLMCDFFF
jgi:vacuolar protein sorting-associated protein 54